MSETIPQERWRTGSGDGSGVYLVTERGAVKIGDFGEGGKAPGGSEVAAQRATLAAAAPDLLAALRAQAVNGAEGPLCFCGATDEEKHDRACFRARYAIAKAEGRANG